MKQAIKTVLLLLMAASLAGPADAARTKSARVEPDRNTTILDAEVMLARIGFSPGVIDAHDGANFTNALHAFQQANGIAPGRLDAATRTRLAQLSSGPVLGAYTIQPEDVAGPFVDNIPHDFQQMAALLRVAYHSPKELLAEKFHMSEALLAALNPGKDLGQAGSVITVANIAGGSPDAKAVSTVGESTGSSTPPETQRAPAAAFVVVDKRQHAVLAYGADKRLLGFYPASIGSAEKPAPSGTLQVRAVARDPDYTYNPKYRFKGQTAERPVTIAPGPNNPVGVV